MAWTQSRTIEIQTKTKFRIGSCAHILIRTQIPFVLWFRLLELFAMCGADCMHNNIIIWLCVEVEFSLKMQWIFHYDLSRAATMARCQLLAVTNAYCLLCVRNERLMVNCIVVSLSPESYLLLRVAIHTQNVVLILMHSCWMFGCWPFITLLKLFIVALSVIMRGCFVDPAPLF